MREGVPSIALHVGYLVAPPLDAGKLISYWFLNLGFSLFLMPLGFVFADRSAKKFFLVAFSFFIIGNLFQFSPEIAANHKFFNLFIIFGNMFSAWAVYLIWTKKLWGKIVAPALVFFLIFSGMIDFFPIKNDPSYFIDDASKNPDIAWIKNNTSADAVFLNSSYIYHPASLAGRKIFLGWPYFSWSAGYNTEQRDGVLREMLNPSDGQRLCFLLHQNKIQYLAIETGTKDPTFVINYSFFNENFLSVYKNKTNDFTIYSVASGCQ